MKGSDGGSEAKEVPVKDEGGDGTGKPHILLKRQSKDETTGRREIPWLFEQGCHLTENKI